MSLSNDLISQLVKAAKPVEKKPTEATVYGTAVVQDGVQYVQLDGSSVLTPVSSTVKIRNGERVVVQIKDHTAMVTGNITTKTARSDDVDDLAKAITEAEILIADKVSTDELDAERARINELVAKNVTITGRVEASEARISELQADNATIKGTVTAHSADIKKLTTEKLDVLVAEAKYAAIESLNATNAKVYNLESVYSKFEQLTTEKLNAVDAELKNLDSKYATITELDVERGRIDDLESAMITADHAVIKQLEAGIAEIDTLIFGSASGNVIQSSFANAVIAMLGNAQIKSAMIESLAASKISAGDILTNKVRVLSEDGRLVISDETMQISDENRVRVQIGKDADGDYSINIWDQNGNLMFSKGGITDSAIKDKIIRDDMVSDTANIAAHKLDIDSLFEEINGSTKTIKSSRVFLDEKSQSLDVAFKAMETDLSGLEETVTSQGTQLSVVQGQITGKVWKQDIKSAVDDVTIGGRNYFIRSRINTLAWGSGNMLMQNPAYRGYSFQVNEGEEWTLYRTDVTNNRWGLYWLTEEPVAGAVEMTIAMRDDSQAANHVNYFTVPSGVTWAFMYLSNASDDIPNIMLEKGNKASDWKPASEDMEANVTSLSTQYSELEQTVESISATVESHTSEISSKADGATVTAMEKRVSSLEVDLDGFRTSVSTEYAKKSELTSTIEQTASEITTNVKSTYATKSALSDVQTELDELEIGGRNYFRSDLVVDLGCTGLASGEQSLISTGSCKGFYVETVPGDVWSLSRADMPNNRFDYCFTVEVPAAGVIISGWNSGYREKLKIEGIVVPDGCNYIFIYLSNQNEELPNIKLERGNRATDWTPAPEDMATSQDADRAYAAAEAAQETANNAETLIQQLSHSISMLVTDGNGTSLMTQTEDGWTFSTADIQANVADIAQSLNSLTSEVGDTGNTVDVLKRAVDDLGEIVEYVKIGTYENEPCIELGESDSEFKMRITNTRILFMEGSNVVAHISNQSLHIKKAVIEEELQQGDFVWQIRSNGNLGLIWKG